MLAAWEWMKDFGKWIGLKLIEFGQPVWLGVVMLAIVVGLSSNGVYDIPTIKAFVDKWFARGQLKQANK